MISIVSMFGVKIRPHRSLVIIVGILICVIIIFLLKSKHSNEISPEIVSDDDINLVDLFDNAFPLVYEAGETIKLFKNTKENYGKIFKTSKNEPVTIADLLSHSIITNGLKSKFKNLKVFSSFIISFFNNWFLFSKIVSEEKDPINWKEFNSIKRQFHVEHKYPKIPFIYNDESLLTFPLSSIAVWIGLVLIVQRLNEMRMLYYKFMNHPSMK
jgi:hypothetical protein